METCMAVLNGALSAVFKWYDYLVLVHCCDRSVIVKLMMFVRILKQIIFHLAILCVQCNCTTSIFDDRYITDRVIDDTVCQLL